jgi:hypothetical protein
MHGQVEVTTGNFVKQKSRDLLSVAAVEATGWGARDPEVKKPGASNMI